MSATETQGLCMTFSNLFIPHAFVCKCVLCVHRHMMSVRSSSELIKLSERRKDVLLFCRRPQKIDSGASFNFSLMKFHYQPLKSATYFITSVRSVCVCDLGFDRCDRFLCVRQRFLCQTSIWAQKRLSNDFLSSHA